MRTLILSDLHANLPAVEAVLRDARARGYDRVVCLGDLVGYGAHPNEVIGLVREIAPWVQVRGNHDKAACGISEAGTFNDAAREAIEWTRQALSPESLDYLRALPEGPLPAGPLLLSHGSPIDEEEYILGESDARDALEATPHPLVLFGHTHFAAIFVCRPGQRPQAAALGRGGVTRLPPGARVLFNPGSIGQPRDHDPRASYAFHDDAENAVEVVRVRYDVDLARQAIVAAGLPRPLEQRLALGV